MEDQKALETATPTPPSLLWFFSTAVCIKLLLIPSYRSTDFEVHRHWLALTHSLSLSDWYSDETSPWTLDYPPFFAYFERFLSIFAHFIDPQIVDINNGLNYKANSVIYFRRIAVILSDLWLLYGVYRLTKNLDVKKRVLICALIVWSPGLVIVDHMHFQYNGFLLGWLLLSISFLQEGKDLMGGFLFAVLLCFKHLFAVPVPVYFVYLLRHYCWKGLVRGFWRLSLMGAVVVAVFGAAYGPFVYHGQAWRNPQRGQIARWIGYAYTCGFLFGWCVHEKASLHFVVPFVVVAVQGLEDAKHYFVPSIGMLLPACIIPSIS